MPDSNEACFNTACACWDIPSCQVESQPFCFRFLSSTLTVTVALFLDRVFLSNPHVGKRVRYQFSGSNSQLFQSFFRSVVRNKRKESLIILDEYV